MTNTLNIEFTEPENTLFELYSLTGSKMLSQEVSGMQKATLNLDQLNPGIYYLLNKEFGYQTKIIVANK
ncbi:MAG: T9SS type A sorting domain-containing protein [Prolixibacteraceae bacterium]